MVSHSEYADGTDRHTDGRQTVTVRRTRSARRGQHNNTAAVCVDWTHPATASADISWTEEFYFYFCGRQDVTKNVMWHRYGGLAPI